MSIHQPLSANRRATAPVTVEPGAARCTGHEFNGHIAAKRVSTRLTRPPRQGSVVPRGWRAATKTTMHDFLNCNCSCCFLIQLFDSLHATHAELFTPACAPLEDFVFGKSTVDIVGTLQAVVIACLPLCTMPHSTLGKRARSAVDAGKSPNNARVSHMQLLTQKLQQSSRLPAKGRDGL